MDEKHLMRFEGETPRFPITLAWCGQGLSTRQLTSYRYITVTFMEQPT